MGEGDTRVSEPRVLRSRRSFVCVPEAWGPEEKAGPLSVTDVFLQVTGPQARRCTRLVRSQRTELLALGGWHAARWGRGRCSLRGPTARWGPLPPGPARPAPSVQCYLLFHFVGKSHCRADLDLGK